MYGFFNEFKEDGNRKAGSLPEFTSLPEKGTYWSTIVLTLAGGQHRGERKKKVL